MAINTIRFIDTQLEIIEDSLIFIEDQIEVFKIENPNLEIKKLIGYCGLDWDENCLKPHKNKSSIRTASINQARKPIYQTSKDTYQYYSKHLKTLFSLLKK